MPKIKKSGAFEVLNLKDPKVLMLPKIIGCRAWSLIRTDRQKRIVAEQI